MSNTDWPRRPLQKIDPAGKPSLTRWRTLKLLPGATDADMASHLLLEPQNGRSQQLRLHLAHIRHTTPGDAVDGGARLQAGGPRLGPIATSAMTARPIRFPCCPRWCVETSSSAATTH